MASDRERKLKERERLKNIISQWNANRLDIFWLSEPNEELEFHGAMRFYFQDAGEKVATKCIRVSSTATTSDVIETLIEKFRPDIRMLSIPEYAIYEIHENGEERKLRDDEKPLLVHLDWHKDDREGRFLLRRMDEKSYISHMDAYDNDHFKRKLSKREKKEKKKREKKEKLKQLAAAEEEEEKKDGIAERLYSDVPETSFTRSISNPEAVMRRRRRQKLEQKLQQFCQEGGTDAGGTLRIFGESINKDVPYKTLLLSVKDTSAYVVKEILDKYGQDKEDPAHYCLVQVIVPPQTSSDGSIHEFQCGGVREYILDDDDCPLAIEHQHNRGRGTLTFHVRRRPADYQPRKRKKKPKPTKGDSENNYRYEDTFEKLPYLLELNPDGSEVQGAPKKHRLYLNVTEVGCERSSSTSGQYLQLFGPNVHPRHCVIAHTEGIVTVTPSSREAETYVNNIRIFETTILKHGMKVRFGKLHTFRFMNPLHEQKQNLLPDPRQSTNFLEKPSRRDDQIAALQPGSYETTFDAEGNVETISTHSRDDRMSKKSDDAHSHRSLGRESSQGRGSYEKFEQRRGNDPILPAVLEFWEESEDSFLTAAITQLDPSHVQFKLSPTYTLYMAARYRASTHFRPETTPSDRAHRLTALMNKVAAVMHQVIQDQYQDSSSLAFWLANTSELLNFLKQDRHLSAYTLDAQDLLAESVQLAFRSLVTCQQTELKAAMPAFLEDRDDISEEEGTTADVLAVLSAAMSLLRRCRVNAALTIQMFSQLFHYINMWLFNKVVCDSRSSYCTRLWGVRLKRRLGRVEAWAEKQGLELAADCHLSRIVQAAHLLQAPKSSADDRTAISSLCFKLNSLQLRSILEKYVSVPEEPEIPAELIESVVKVAENTADEQARSEGREVKLQEDTDLQLPFLLPEDGYSCDIVRGVPAGLQEFLQPLIQTGWCQLTIQPTSSGYWTIYMADQDIGRIPPGARSPSVHSHAGDGESQTWNQQLPVPEVSTIRLQKSNSGIGLSVAGTHSPSVHSHTGDGDGQTWSQQLPVPEVTTIRLQKSNNGIGLSIVAAGGIDQDKLGIYVRSVVKGGAADLDGRLQAGDQLLKVDGQSLVGVNQEKAAELMTRTGPVVSLEIAKQGAIYNGLADLLSKPSPIIQRGPRRMSERDIPGRLMSEQGQEFRQPTGHGHLIPPRMMSSKSVPSLNSGHTQEPTRTPSNGAFHTHEVYNPAYSRTSSTTSIPKSAEFSENGTRARSSNNLRQELPSDARYPSYNNPGDQNPPPYPGPPAAVNGRPLSQPNLLQQQQLPLPLPPGHQEERHYQNISMYQQPQQQPTQQQPNPRPPAQPYPLPPSQPPRPLHGSQSSLNRPEPQGVQTPNDRSRPLSTLVSSREQEQYVNSVGYAHSPGSGPPPSPKGPRLPEDNRHGPQVYGQRLPDHRDFHSTEHLRHMENDQRSIHSESWEQNHRIYPAHQELDPRQRHLDPVHQLDPRQRDLIRQEAKMEEMREEVRRREDRERMVQNQMGRGGPAPWGYPRGPNPGVQLPPGYNMPPPVSVPLGNGPPPPQGPKPRPPFSSPHANERFQRPPPGCEPNLAEGTLYYQDAAHMQALPNAGHPAILQHNPQRLSNPPPPAVSYRYGPTGYPPRSEAPSKPGQPPRPLHNDPRMPAPHGRPSPSQSQSSKVTFELPQSSVGHDRKDPSSLTSPSPWEREEKEKQHKQRLEEARRARDEEIMQLESIPYMSAKQEERLRTLRLEREFQRRAEELHGDEDDDDDDELLERAENRERMLKMQEDLEKARQRRLEWEHDQTHLNQPKQMPVTQQEDWKKHQSLEEQEGRLRQLRLEEVNRKKELEAAKSAEERLLREARRRQDEYKGPQCIQPPIQSKPNQQTDNSSFVNQNYIAQKNPGTHPYGQDDVPPPLPTSPPPIETNYAPVYSQNPNEQPKMPMHSHPSLRNQPSESSHLVLNSIRVSANEKSHEPPAPPQRKSSYEVTNQISGINNRYISSTVRNGDGNNPVLHPKKVSFQEKDVLCDTNGNMDYVIQTHHTTHSAQSYTLEDIDEVLATPHNTQNLNMYNPGATPGVIGAQEVYRDPRQRIEAERTQQEHYTSRSVGPEKLTFKEKMKMFAQETGEPETPKDKVKISRAQRDIETNLNGT